MQGQFVFIILQNRNDCRLHQPTTSTTTLGRAESNQIVLQDSLVSRNHAVVDHGRDTWLLCDLQSRNGTFVNERPIQETALLAGDVIRIRPFQITICLPGTNPDSVEWRFDDDTQKLAPVTPPHPAVEARPPDLTPMQQRVLQFLLEGLGEKQIAAELGRSVNTIHWHSTMIYSKYGISSRAELFALRLRDLNSTIEISRVPKLSTLPSDLRPQDVQ